MNDGIKIALISAIVSVTTALVAAGAAIYPNLERARVAASAAEHSAIEAEAAAVVVKDAVLAIPGALATHYRGSMKVANATTSRFNFSERVYDPDRAVQAGDDWRLTVPVSGIYYLGVSFRLPYGPNGASNITPYVSCTLSVVRVNTTIAVPINQSIAFNPSCSLSGVHFLSEGDQLFGTLGQAGAYPGNVTGDFFSVLVGNGKDE